MSKLIFLDNVHKIYVSEMEPSGSIEVSLEVNNSPLCIKLKDLKSLEDLSKKMIALNQIFFNSTD